MSSDLFILAGNGPYDNSGCEAIVRGTSRIVRSFFEKPTFMAISHFASAAQYERQAAGEYDQAINHKRIYRPPRRYSPKWCAYVPLRLFYPMGTKRLFYREMLPYLKSAKAVLSVGGDNYSLDYGTPMLFTDLDDLVLKYRKPIIIWGASVGPFEKIPDYEKYMINHLRKVNGIFARETATIDYLSSKGLVENVYRVADPAFLLEPVAPEGITIGKDAIGLNLSPLMANYVSDGDLKKWVVVASDIVSSLSDKSKRKIYLIPHVTTPGTNDYQFLRDVLHSIDQSKRDVELIPDTLNAAELKWVIGRMSVFAGARTHSTIAALSSAVPTLSFAYSVKAMGINKDIFGDARYCLSPTQMNPQSVIEKIGELMADSMNIRSHLMSQMPQIKQLALDAGKYLHSMVSARDD